MTGLADMHGPPSLRHASLAVRSGRPYAAAMKEFLDAVSVRALPPSFPGDVWKIDPSFVEDEPEAVPDPVLMAHMAGVAESISSACGRKPPEWSERDCYFLDRPAIPAGSRRRTAALADTPSAFRRRLLFCGPSLSRLFRKEGRSGSQA